MGDKRWGGICFQRAQSNIKSSITLGYLDKIFGNVDLAFNTYSLVLYTFKENAPFYKE